MMSFYKYQTGNARRFSLRFFGVSVLCYSISHNHGWIRAFGIGVKWKHKSKGLLFSERYGHKKYVKIGDWVLGYLPPIKI